MARLTRILILFAILTVANFQLITAAPARPQPFVYTQPDGSTITLMQRGDEWGHWMTDLDGNQMLLDEAGFYRRATKMQSDDWKKTVAERWQKKAEERSRRTHAMPATRGNDGSHYSFPTKGKVRGLVVLVEYMDVRFSIDDPHQQFTDMMNKPGYNYSNGKNTHIGSAHDYFYDNSLGQFDPQFDVYGPILLSHERAYYGENDANGSDKRPQEMIIEACEQLHTQGIDFSQYDADNNNLVDFVFAIYAGEGEANPGVTSDAVWPHEWEVFDEHRFDGKRLCEYACANELSGNSLDGVGTFCHEFSHVLGLHDLYDTNGEAEGVNGYSVLDRGCYRQNGYCPVGYSSYERYELGWLTPTLLPDNPATLILKDFGVNNEAYVYPVPSDSEVADIRDGEYYLFENRQNTRWDAYLPGHGMVVWHIDHDKKKFDSNHVNTWIDHQCVDLIEADGMKEQQDGSETFPGTAGHTEFTDDTTPAFSGWSEPRTESMNQGHRLGKPITNIHETYDDSDIALLVFDVSGGKHELISNIAIKNNSVSILKGETLLMQVSISPISASSNTLEWTSSDESIATVSAAGLVTAVAPGVCTITATATGGSGLSTSCEVTVIPTLVDYIYFRYLYIELWKGDEFQVVFEVRPDLADNKTLVWTSSDESVATVSNSGLITAVSGGVCTITATAADGSGLSTSCEVTVIPTLVDYIEMNNPDHELKKGEEFQMNAVVYPDNADNKILVWTSSDESVATVSSTGLVTAVGTGYCLITATAIDERGATVSRQVTVSPTLVQSIELNYSTYDLQPGMELQLEAVVTPELADNKTIRWTSSDESVVTVDDTGKVHFVDYGYATVDATATDGSWVIATCVFTNVDGIETISSDAKSTEYYTPTGIKVSTPKKGMYIVKDKEAKIYLKK